jgi:hypothetical protein
VQAIVIHFEPATEYFSDATLATLQA